MGNRINRQIRVGVLEKSQVARSGAAETDHKERSWIKNKVQIRCNTWQCERENMRELSSLRVKGMRLRIAHANTEMTKI